MNMYSNEEKIQHQFDSFELGFAGQLDIENRWIKKAKMIPWDDLEPLYTHHFNNSGRPAKRFRVALGTLIIQETLKLSDRDTVEAISENPYMQFFLGFPGFNKTKPFDASLLVYFRKRLDWKSLSKINDVIVNLPKKEDPVTSDPPVDDQNSGSGGLGFDPENPYPRTLIVDATCTPADIRHPDDLTLLDEARRSTENIIDIMCDATKISKPRTYRRKARRDFLLAIKKRNKGAKEIRKAIGQQLRYVKRNLQYIDGIVTASFTGIYHRNSCLLKLSAYQYKSLLVINELYRQQNEMYRAKNHKVSDRIVSIMQPHIRPIVRGKARSNVEFGAKISVGVANGYVFVDKIDFNAYSESHDIELHAEAYKKRTGYYPDRILGDKAYQNRANRDWCAQRGIRLMGKRLGRPYEDPLLQRAFDKIGRLEEGERVIVEGKIGVQKRRYGWDLITGKLPVTAETMIMLAALVGNLEQRLRDIFLAFFAGWKSMLYVFCFWCAEYINGGDSAELAV